MTSADNLQAFTPELAAQHATNGMHLDDLEVSALPKRTRDDDYEWNESEWTAEEMDVLESVYPRFPNFFFPG